MLPDGSNTYSGDSACPGLHVLVSPVRFLKMSASPGDCGDRDVSEVGFQREEVVSHPSHCLWPRVHYYTMRRAGALPGNPMKGKGPEGDPSVRCGVVGSQGTLLPWIL